jgi:hypothetical protein
MSRTWRVCRGAIPPQILADRMMDAVRREWGHDPLRDWRLDLFMEHVVKAYVSLERRITEIKYEYRCYLDEHVIWEEIADYM